jgi:hypothetical protein
MTIFPLTPASAKQAGRRLDQANRQRLLRIGNDIISLTELCARLDAPHDVVRVAISKVRRSRKGGLTWDTLRAVLDAQSRPLA